MCITPAIDMNIVFCSYIHDDVKSVAQISIHCTPYAIVLGKYTSCVGLHFTMDKDLLPNIMYSYNGSNQFQGIEMSQLENLIENCKTMGEVVVIGDMNVHFGSEYGGRCWGSTSPNGKRLMSCLKNHDMCVVDIGEKGRGEGYTLCVN